MTGITLPWMDLIRKRREEIEEVFSPNEWRVIDIFLKPIIKYGEENEKRITEAYQKEKEVIK